MYNLDTLIPIVLAFLVVTVSPGPANLATALVAMRYGRRRSLLFGAGLALGLACWGVVAATGMGAILQGSANLLIGLKVCGGLYLLWLALQSTRAAKKPELEMASPKQGRWFVRGLMLNLSNPKAVLAWMAALSLGMGADGGGGQVVIATALCSAIGLVNYLLYGLAFSLPGCMSVYRNLRRWIEGIVAGLFAVAGFALIRSAFTR